MKIKVCGLKDPENIRAVSNFVPDYMGFIFYGNSPRFINDVPFEQLNNIPASIFKTAVFVNESAERINELIDKYSFDAIQLHGNESPEFCNSFKDKVKVIKAFGLNNSFNFEQLAAYKNKVDFFLFDTKTDIHGGSGKTFDWSILNKYILDVPFFLSGGLSLDNLEEIKNISHPQFYGVDLNSKFETEPGIKNIEKLEKAFDIIKQNITNELRS
ncbi:MAG: N-(5-phosphoribosyl)anthranilate isomerase [Mucilaginibacter sp.]|jgi:phosphoribosylanthranilate isomerase|nr:N-(5-phosphoribosyl)anthranilate isomerase [Mucilaginibacter sp.]